MSFEVGAGAYARFMGRYSEPLAAEFIALVGGQRGQRALDVGCGPGALTAQLVERFGPDAVSAVDPSVPFVDAARARFPQVDVRCAGAEQLPFPDDTFDRTLAQLVVQFMTDAVAGLTEMARVTRPNGLVAASVWDHTDDRGPLSLFWRAVCELDPHARGESGAVGVREGHLAELFNAAGLQNVQSSILTVRVGYETFSDWWEPYTFGVGTAGSHVAGLDAQRRSDLRAQCEKLLPTAPFEITASAWVAVGTAS